MLAFGVSRGGRAALTLALMVWLGGLFVLSLDRWESGDARFARQLSTWTHSNCCACPEGAAVLLLSISISPFHM